MELESIKNLVNQGFLLKKIRQRNIDKSKERNR